MTCFATAGSHKEIPRFFLGPSPIEQPQFRFNRTPIMHFFGVVSEIIVGVRLIHFIWDLCCLQWAIHTLWPLIMTDAIPCVFCERMCVNPCVRVRGSVSGVHTQCMCVCMATTRICNNHTHTQIPVILPLCVRCLENCHSHFR